MEQKQKRLCLINYHQFKQMSDTLSSEADTMLSVQHPHPFIHYICCECIYSDGELSRIGGPYSL